MSKFKLFTGCASAALFIAVSTGNTFAQNQTITVVDQGGADILQSTTNNNSVSNSADISVDNISPTGRGVSVGASAVGAQSAVAGTFINEVTTISVGDIDQTTVQRDTVGGQSIPEISNVATVAVGNINGNGASVQISSAGSVSAVSASYVNSSGDVTIDDIDQDTRNNPFPSFGGGVRTNGDIDNNGTIGIGGHGATLSISSIGAASSVSISGIGKRQGGSSLDDVTIGEVNQVTVNRGTVTTNHNGGTGNGSGVISVTNGISGNGASIGVSASGAVSAVGISSVNNSTTNRDITVDDVTQTTASRGQITNRGGTINVGSISGTGAGVSISATGAASQVAVSSINDAQVGDVNLGQISQTSTNYGYVSNTGTITTGNVTGAGASVSVGAVGAASAVSFSAVK